MRIYPLKKVTIVVGGGGGNIPPGAAVMTDDVALFARVTLTDSNAAITDAILTALAASYPDTIAATTETIKVGPAIADTAAGQTETITVGPIAAETLAAQTETIKLALAGYAETVNVQTETIKAGASGYADTVAAKTETVAGDVYAWATGQSTSGTTAPTNPTNALADKNATLANCKAGGLANGTSILTLTIQRAAIPNTGTYTFRAYYRTNAGTTDTFTMNYTDTGGNPVTITLAAGNFLTTPADTAITSLHATNTISVVFNHAAVTPSVGGSLDVDAVCIRTIGAF